MFFGVTKRFRFDLNENRQRAIKFRKLFFSSMMCYGHHMFFSVPTSCSSGNAFVSGAGCLRSKSQAGQIEHSVANDLPLLQHFLERSGVAWAQ